MFKLSWKPPFITKEKTSQIPATPVQNNGDLPEGKVIKLWATFYYSKVLHDTKNRNDIPLLNMKGEELGPRLKSKDWCLAGIEGTVCIDGVVYNYAGSTGKSQTTCPISATEKIRWMKSPYPYGIGSKNNPLIPFVSIATDPKVIPFGKRVYIKEAVGLRYVVGNQEWIHDGIFRADDVGGAIKGNHIDVFLGNVEGGILGAEKINPFKFIKSNANGTFTAVILN